MAQCLPKSLSGSTVTILVEPPEIYPKTIPTRSSSSLTRPLLISSGIKDIKSNGAE
ncbi:hypothetical protein COLO4_01961 [Corchorus olitorius]|uniref:Uncharacterized protein n=1 Tax=Corchorus olitorius TaxID=93759 RepID=A0A1R3L1Q5_9ROSI|nr:hypothetical protein COLO4_01961 [Corchorus olitorius]